MIGMHDTLPWTGPIRLGWFLAALIVGMASPLRADTSTARPIVYNRDIRPILAEYCWACHGPDAKHREAELRLDVRDEAVQGTAIVPGQPDASLLIQRIETADDDQRMPPRATLKSLTVAQRELLRRWIAEGAPYQRHWSWEPLVATPPPPVPGVTHPIDRFIVDRLNREGLQSSPAADPATLARRVSLDLTGLPPDTETLDNFFAEYQRAPERAYERLVDSLLSSPHYGERWGRWWLDQARYADSNGYSIDAPRQIWPYRDWVVQALNADLPFDQFTLWQLAGDLVPSAGQSGQIATGFHRNTQINEEGGIDPEQFRIESIFDRVATTGTVWLGLTIGCAQCHDHKFDPLTQQEYYRLFAFFNNQDEPSLKVSANGVDSAPSTLVLAERPEPRQTNVLIKGDFTRPADTVSPGTPSLLPPLPPDVTSPDRADLARWLTSSDNPLTSRVIVNRVWQQYFGRGIVETENDFGTQGSYPTHPELLDWLAIDFSSHGWSLKHLHRRLVTSHTYRQSSNVHPDLHHRDPQNYLLARQHRLRLDAEVIRDVALAASGLLADKLGGPPVFPPIPEGVMGQGQVKHAWTVSRGEDRYRRGMYTFIFRASPPPALNVFDAPDGYSTCTRRLRSNTPLQALTLLNDDTSVEFAQALETMIRKDGLAAAFRRCTSRWPDSEELALLQSVDASSAARILLNLDETITRE